jgi:hypothetical protein
MLVLHLHQNQSSRNLHLQESVHTMLSITHHTRKRPSTGPRTTHGPHIANMQQQVEEAEVQVAALQAIVALQPLLPIQAHPEEEQDLSGLDPTSQAGPPLPTPPASPTESGASVGN